MAGLRVALFDEDRLVREPLALYLRNQPVISEVYEAATAEEAVRLSRRGVDVLVLELDPSAEDSGHDVLEALRHLQLAVPVLALLARRDHQAATEAFLSGAAAAYSTEEPARGLVDVLARVAAGQVLIPPEIVGAMTRRIMQERRRGDQRRLRAPSGVLLSPRETEVLGLLAEGKRRAEIATLLGVSRDTVRTQLRNGMRKLGVHSELEAAALVRKLRQGNPEDHSG